MWTKKYYDKFDKAGWEKVLKSYTYAMKDIDIENWELKMKFTYHEKTKDTGNIEIQYEEKALGDMRVKKENGKWLINEL